MSAPFAGMAVASIDAVDTMTPRFLLPDEVHVLDTYRRMREAQDKRDTAAQVLRGAQAHFDKLDREASSIEAEFTKLVQLRHG